MGTEGVDPRYADLDRWSTDTVIAVLLESQIAGIAAVRSQTGAIAAAADSAAERLRTPAARLVYVGAGTSGRVAVQDGVELGPTFDWSGERLAFVLAGGAAATTASAEGAEDDGGAGVHAMRGIGVTADDVVIAVAASGTTPFTVAALVCAGAAGALTVAVANNAGTPLLAAAHHPVLLDTGAEAVAGSTRMNAGTAQKVALNLLSTAIMVRLGRVHRGLMVDMRITNAKLRERAVRIVAMLSERDADTARRALTGAGGRIKPATLVAMGVPLAAAERALADSRDNLRTALAVLGHPAC